MLMPHKLTKINTAIPRDFRPLGMFSPSAQDIKQQKIKVVKRIQKSKQYASQINTSLELKQKMQLNRFHQYLASGLIKPINADTGGNGTQTSNSVEQSKRF
jgi:hypothetical protein